MKQFNIITEVLDYGECVTRLMIRLDTNHTQLKASNDSFIVEAKTYKEDGSIYYEGPRTVTNIFLYYDYLVIDLECKYGNKDCASIYYDMVMQDGVFDFFHSFNKDLKLEYTLKQVKDIEIDGKIINDTYMMNKVINPLVDQFSKHESTNLKYRLYAPRLKQEQYPLIVWIHGSGEGGINNTAHIKANKGAVAFVKEDTQKIFNGAYVVAIQCPYNWSVHKKDLGNISIPLPKVIEESEDYVPEVMEILDHIQNNYPIDANRIYIAGCSAGASMVWNMILRNPHYFACAIPICGPKIEDPSIVSHLPIWMVHSKNDTTVDYTYSVENFKTLNNDHTFVTLYDNMDPYPGHWSWIHALNNDPIINGITLFEWMAKQRR